MSKEIKDKKLEQATRARATADAYAKSVGKDNIKEVIQPIVEGLNSKDEVQVELAKNLARGTVEQLTKLILKQEIFTTSNAAYMEFVNKFNDGVVKEGNAKLYDFNHLTSCDTYNPNQFVPNALSAPNVDEFTIQMYKADGTLNDTQAYQFRKQLVVIESK